MPGTAPTPPPARACGCADFNRTALLRHGVAEAGRGLRAIEPGMPLPAGTGLSRRSFLLRASGMALSVYGAAALGPRAFEEGIRAARAAAPSEPVLVSIFLNGGIDSLSVLAPVGESRYYTLRSTLAIGPDPTRTFSEDTRLQWHSAAAPLQTLHGEGKVSVVPAIGYDDPNQSHFTSRHFWEVGELDEAGRFGWLGRYLDAHGVPDNPLQGLSLSYGLSPALAPASVPVASVADPASFSLYARDVWDSGIEAALPVALGDLAEPAAGDAALAGARRAAGHTATLNGQLAGLQGTSPPYQQAVAYPSGNFGRRLATLAEMLGDGLPVRCVALDAPGGYDTHDNQLSTFGTNLGRTCDALYAFQRDLEARGLADRVLVHVWSEFGRRPQQNGSGTDHGAGGVSFVIGTQARGQLIGEFPGLAQLDPQSNLRSTADFRALYCSLLEQWLGADAAPIIPGASGFARPAVVRP
jgi:uncharacterized protein (DUF1501 family)